MECFICETKGEKTTLFDAVIREGVIKICESCSVKENIPIIRSPTPLQLKESEKNQTVYEKLSHMAGLDPEKHKAKFGGHNERLMRQNDNLRKIVEEKKELSFPNLKQIKLDSREDLIRNYHWAVLQARRARKLTQKQLGEAISEPEASIKLIERGILPDNYHPFIRKLQTYLGITLFTKPVKKELGFDKVTSASLTLSDIQEINGKVEEDSVKPRGFFPYWKKKLGFLQKKREDKNEKENIKYSEEKDEFELEESEESNSEEKQRESKIEEKSKQSKDISQEDINRIIFGK